MHLRLPLWLYCDQKIQFHISLEQVSFNSQLTLNILKHWVAMCCLQCWAWGMSRFLRCISLECVPPLKVWHQFTLAFSWNAIYVQLFPEMDFIKVCHQFNFAFRWNAIYTTFSWDAFYQSVPPFSLAFARNALPTTVWGTDTSLFVISCNRHLPLFFEQQEVQKMRGQGLISATQFALKI